MLLHLLIALQYSMLRMSTSWPNADEVLARTQPLEGQAANGVDLTVALRMAGSLLQGAVNIWGTKVVLLLEETKKLINKFQACTPQLWLR